MGLEQESHATASLEFQEAPGEVAAALVSLLGRIGKVKTVHRESGLIDGKITRGVSFGTSPRCKIQVRGKGDGTEIEIDIRCTESIAINWHRSEKALRILTDEITSDAALSLSAKTGW